MPAPLFTNQKKEEMNKELQDLTWSLLPREFKEEVKRVANNFSRRTSGILGRERTLAETFLNEFIDLFGRHNLTSDAEGEEMLTVPRKKVQELFNEYQELYEKFKGKCHDKEVALRVSHFYGKMCALSDLFGSKCLPDETSPKEATSAESATRPATAEPKNKDSELLHPESVENLRNPHEKSHSRHNSPKTADCDNHLADVGKMMDRRLNIAAMAMQGILANQDALIYARDHFPTLKGGLNRYYAVARCAFAYADALLEGGEDGED